MFSTPISWRERTPKELRMNPHEKCSRTYSLGMRSSDFISPMRSAQGMWRSYWSSRMSRKWGIQPTWVSAK